MTAPRPLLVFGSINLDVSLRVPRFVAAGETLPGSDLQMSPGGKGANQALAARRDGAEVRLVGAVGDDALAAPALALLQDAGVTLEVRRMPDVGTGVALIQVDASGDNAIALAPGANDTVRVEHVAAEWWATHELLLQGELAPEVCMQAAALATQAGRSVIVNFAPARALHLLQPALIDWLVLNEGELQALAAHLRLPGGVREQARALAWQVRRGVVVTLGAQGVLATARDDAGLPGGEVRLPAHRVPVQDTTGAGDAFCGVWAAALARGAAPLQALQRANAAAALACTKRGAQAALPWAHETDALLNTSKS